MANAYEKLVKANDDYHEAMTDILLNEDIDVYSKADIGAIVHSIFSNMTRVNEIVAPFYED